MTWIISKLTLTLFACKHNQIKKYPASGTDGNKYGYFEKDTRVLIKYIVNIAFAFCCLLACNSNNTMKSIPVYHSIKIKRKMYTHLTEINASSVLLTIECPIAASMSIVDVQKVKLLFEKRNADLAGTVLPWFKLSKSTHKNILFHFIVFGNKWMFTDANSWNNGLITINCSEHSITIRKMVGYDIV